MGISVKWNMIILAVAFFGAGAPTGVAAIIAPGEATLASLTALSPTDPSLQGTTIASETVPIPSVFDSSTQLLVDEKVVQNTAGVLDFYYKVQNPPNQSYLLKDFGFEFSAGNALQLSVAYLDEGNLAPSTAVITTTGGTSGVNYHFGPETELDGVPLPDTGTDWLLLRTNASAYTTGSLGATRWHDDFTSDAPAFVPDARLCLKTAIENIFGSSPIVASHEN